MSLPRPLSMVSQGIAGSSGPEISITSAPCAASVRPATGPAITRDRSSTRKPGERAIALRPWFGRGLADLLDRDQRQLRERFGMRRRRPFVVTAHHRDHAAGGIGRGLEFFGLPLHQRRLHVVALGLAIQAPCRRRRGDAGNWCAAARSGCRRFCRRRRWRPRPEAAACRRRADSARSGIRRRHDACRRPRPAPRRCAASRFRQPQGRHAAIAVCAAAATRNEDGICGSSPVSVTRASAAASPPAEVQTS